MPVSLDEVIAVALDTSAIDADSKRISIVSGGTPGLEVLGNEEQVTAAVANLVANAVSYSGCDSTVLVSTKVTDGNVEISVVDQGIGIPENEIDRIFERFYRVDRPATGPPAAPGSASRSSSTSPPPTAATSVCGRWRDKALHSP